MVNAINFKIVAVVSSKREKIKIKIVNKIIPTNSWMITQKTNQWHFSNRTVDIGKKKIREEEEAWNGPHSHGRLFDV